MRKFDTFAYNETAGKSFFSCHFFVLIYTETDVSWYLGLKVSQTLGRWPSCPATLFLSSTSFEMASRLLISLSCNLCASLGRRCFQSDMIIGILPEVSPIRQRDWTVPWNVMNFQEFLNDFDIIFIVPREPGSFLNLTSLSICETPSGMSSKGRSFIPKCLPFLSMPFFGGAR